MLFEEKKYSKNLVYLNPDRKFFLSLLGLWKSFSLSPDTVYIMLIPYTTVNKELIL